ncbi:MAG: tetraacyldisaccharide 4'-kinase [Candidatus Omnitrophica bacterium]|jgi:tetraacyldisaccharide 4'-kinase|nr:tetraacyldisaccharide 4'-kinase [Candidatus Omnitrophota bacterium]
MFLSLKSWYLNFLDKDKRNLLENFFYFFLYLLSLLYGLIVILRNILYDRNLIKTYSSQAKVISVGNISWAGSGKTPFCIWLYEKLSSQFKVAVLRRGYGKDEDKLLKEKIKDVFSSPNRCELVRKFESLFDLFILDDGFQHRRLKRDIDILIMGAREFTRKYRLIPAYFFREPFSSLRRANIIILNYCDDIKNLSLVRKNILTLAPHAKVYCSRYSFKNIKNLANQDISIERVKKEKLAAFAAIGYPEGFFNKLKDLGLDIQLYLKYPDHYELSKDEFNSLQEDLIRKNIFGLVITAKDKYHLPTTKPKVDIYILNIEIEIENNQDLLETIISKISKN